MTEGRYNPLAKQTKNIITREWVEKEMRSFNSTNIRHHLILSVMYTLIFIPITALSIFLICEIIDPGFWKIPCAILVAVFFSSPSWGLIWTLFQDLLDRKRLANGLLEITTAPLHHKREKAVWRRWQSRVEEFLCFKGFDAYRADHTNYQLATEKDLFYLVHFRGKKEIKLLYSAKMYEYQTEESNDAF